jgi:hypothetical protein
MRSFAEPEGREQRYKGRKWHINNLPTEFLGPSLPGISSHSPYAMNDVTTHSSLSAIKVARYGTILGWLKSLET